MRDQTSTASLADVRAWFRKASKPQPREFLVLTGAYTLKPGDLGKYIACTGTFTITVPQDAVISKVGYWCDIVNEGVGVITVAGAGISWIAGGDEIAAKKAATLTRRGVDTYSLIGSLT